MNLILLLIHLKKYYTKKKKQFKNSEVLYVENLGPILVFLEVIFNMGDSSKKAKKKYWLTKILILGLIALCFGLIRFNIITIDKWTF